MADETRASRDMFLKVAFDDPQADRSSLLGYVVPRAIVIGSCFAVGFLLERREIGRDLSPALAATVMATVSVLASWWFAVAVASIGSALLLFLASSGRLRESSPLKQPIIQLNRQVGHVEAIFTWVVLALLLQLRWHPLALQLGGAALVITSASLLVDGIAWMLAKEPERARFTRVDLNRERRPVTFFFTGLGLAILFALAPGQLAAVKGLYFAVLTGAVLRLLAWLRDRRQGRAASRALDARTFWDESQAVAVRRGQRFYDRAVLSTIAVLVVAVTAFAIEGTSAQGARDRRARGAVPKLCAEGQAPPDASLFLFSDTQLHTLSGKGNGFQVGLVDAVVPVAVRPVELELLSGATLRHFAARYRALADQRPGTLWANLGDIGDIGCEDELERFVDIARRDFGAHRLAGLVPGNHDTAFLGNVFWHPEWDSSCQGRRGGRAKALATIRGLLDPPSGAILAVSDLRDDFLATLARLGESGDRKVLGLFLDTTDFRLFQLGVAGVQGSISRTQVRWARKRLEEHGEDLVVLFLHHPLAELKPSSREAVVELARSISDRLLLVVSGHTHLAAHRIPDGDGQPLEEVVIGSTTDAPQEAAILEVGRGPGGGHWARVRTVAAVERGGLGCQPPLPDAIPAQRCRELRDALLQRPACEELRSGTARRRHRQLLCSNCADSRCTGEDLGAEQELHCEQQARAWSLLKCLEPWPEAATDPFPLDDPRVADRLAESYGRDPAGSPDRRETLVCLSWAASILQHEKQDGWNIARALALAFDQGSTYGELAVHSTRSASHNPTEPRAATASVRPPR